MPRIRPVLAELHLKQRAGLAAKRGAARCAGAYRRSDGRR